MVAYSGGLRCLGVPKVRDEGYDHQDMYSSGPDAEKRAQQLRQAGRRNVTVEPPTYDFFPGTTVIDVIWSVYYNGRELKGDENFIGG